MQTAYQRHRHLVQGVQHHRELARLCHAACTIRPDLRLHPVQIATRAKHLACAGQNNDPRTSGPQRSGHIRQFLDHSGGKSVTLFGQVQGHMRNPAILNPDVQRLVGHALLSPFA